MKLNKSKSQFTPLQKIMGYLFTLLLLLITLSIAGILLFIFSLDTVLPITNYYLAKKWEPTTCLILTSTTESRKSYLSWLGLERRSLPFNKKHVTYQYQFSNQTYVGNRYSFIPKISSGNPFDGFHRYMSKQVATVPSELLAGNAVACYVNPNNPKESVIDRSFNNSLISTITPIIYPILILFAIYAVFRYRKSPLLAGEDQSFPSLSERTDQLMKAMKKDLASEQKDPLLIWSNQLSNIFYIAMMIIVLYLLYLFVIH
jgi:hypothetical protein